MNYSIYRYYYFLNDEAEKLTNMREELGKLGVSPQLEASLSSDSRYFFLFLDNLAIMVLHLNFPAHTWSQYRTFLDDLEIRIPFPPPFLAKVTVLAAENMPREAMEKERVHLKEGFPVLSVEKEQMRLSRLQWGWPEKEAVYTLFSESQLTSRQRGWLEQDLPSLEGRFIRMHVLSKLYRERGQAVMEEMERLEQRLALLLHTSLVQAFQAKLSSLENQMEELSTAYAILAGDYRLIQEGISQINSFIETTQRTLAKSIFRVEEAYQREMLAPYVSLSQRLSRIAEMLKTSLENHKAAIEVTRGKIDIMLSHQTIEMQDGIKGLLETNTAIQRQSLVFQFAAGLIEFIVVAYYSLSIWKALAPEAFHLIPGWAALLLVLLFALATVNATHVWAEKAQGHEKTNTHLITAFLLVVLVLASILTVTIFFNHPTAH